METWINAGKRIAGNVGKSATGNIEKAKLTLYDHRYLDEGAVTVERYQSGGVNKKKVTLKDLQGKTVYTTKELEESVTDQGLESKKTELTRTGGEKRSFIVKFNPSTMSIQGTGGGKHYIANYADEAAQSGLSYKPLPTRIQFSVELLFDTTQNFEFVKKAVGAISNSDTLGKALGSKESVENSVRMQVEGFVAALRHPRTRVLEFNWGHMSYKGTLNSLDIQYTMFSPEGFPLRAKVRMGMTLVDEKVGQGDMGYWSNKVKEIFPSGYLEEESERGVLGYDPRSNITDNRSASQYVNSLLNISL